MASSGLGATTENISRGKLAVLAVHRELVSVFIFPVLSEFTGNFAISDLEFLISRPSFPCKNSRLLRNFLPI